MSGNGVSEKSDQQTSSVKIDDAPVKDLQHQSQTPASAQTQPSKGSEVSEASASAPAASAPPPAVTPSSKAATPVAKPATGGQQAKNAHNSVPQSHLNQAEQNHSDYNQYSGAYYQYNPNYNANYNGTYSNYKNHYNGGAGGGSGSGNHKQYSGNNRQGGGSGNSSRYNNNNSNNNNNNNSNNTNAAGNSNNAQGGPAHRKQYNNSNHHQKNMNHGNHNLAPGQQLPQGQYVNYNYGAAAAPQYYQFGGFYPPVYVQPLQYTAAAQSYATPGSGGATPQHQHQRTSSHSSSPKVTLTTKDGKPVDLEEKKRQTASSTPVASPLQKNASPVPSSTKVAVESSKSPVVKEASLSTPASNATTTTTTTTTATTSTATKSDADNASNTKTSANLSAAEEFKRRIRERAAANAAKKKQQEEQSSGQKTESGSKQEKPDEDAKKDTVEEPSHPAQEPAAKDQTAVAKETKEETKPETTIETTPEVKTSTEQNLESPKPVEKPEAAEPTVKPTEQKSEELNKTDEHTAEPAEKELQATTKPAESAESAEKPKEQTKEQKEENVDVNVNDNDNDNDDDEEDEDEDEEDETEAGEPVQELSITQFLERLNQATPIDNILAVEYPQNINGVDKTKQLPSKKYRYDPQFLIQFRDVVQYSIDADFKTRYEYLDVGAQQGMRRQGSAREGSLRGLGAGGMRQGSGLPSRYSGPQGKGGLPSAYDSSRQNSRSGSKRRGVSTRDKSIRKGPSTRRGGRGEMREKTEEELAKEQKPVEEVKPLEKSANRWIPKSRQQKTEVRYAEDGSVILEKEDVERKIKSLLNKLTLEMFTEITDEILDITKQSRWEKDASTIKQTISLTFAKACDEPYWSEMYAKFCAKMTQNILPEITDETSTLKDGSHPAGGALARRVLLSTCQVEYEKGWIDKLPTNEDGSPIEPEMMSDEYYAMAAAKRRGLGLVKFIGHLYNLNMLNDQIIYVCLRDQCSNTTDPSEDRIENLAQLIKTVGPKMDSNERTRGMLTGVFESIKQILEKAQLSSRIKFMLMDIQDLKAARWQSGKAEAQPTTIGAIHRDAEMSRLKQEQEKRKRGPGPSGGSSHYGGNKAAPSRSASNSDFFSNSGFKKSPSFARSNSSLRGGNSIDRVDRSDRSERNAHSPVSSGSDLQRDSSRRSENQQVNRFAALDNDDEEEEEEEEEQEEVHDNNNNNNNNSEDKQEVGAEGKGKKEDI